MRQCPKCSGPLDNKGKCIVCGTTTRIDLCDEDGKIITHMPEDIKKAVEKYCQGKPRGLTVQEVIDRLILVENKNKLVFISYEVYGDEDEDTQNDNVEYVTDLPYGVFLY